jgi:hypothetical protein
LRYCEYNVGSFGSSANAESSSDDDSSDEDSEVYDTDDSINKTNTTANSTAATAAAAAASKSIMSARSGTLHDSRFEQALAIVKQQQTSQQLKPLHYVSWRGQFIPLYSQPIADAVVTAKDAIGELMKAVRQHQQRSTSSNTSSKGAAVKLQKELYNKLFKAWDTVIHLLQEQLVALQSKVHTVMLKQSYHMRELRDSVYAAVQRMHVCSNTDTELCCDVLQLLAYCLLLSMTHREAAIE